MNADLLSYVLGIVTSLLLAYVPGLRARFAALDATRKRLIMLALMVLTALGIFAAGCAGLTDAVTCDKAGAIKLLRLAIEWAVASQTAFLLSPRDAKAKPAAPVTSIPVNTSATKPTRSTKVSA